MDNSSNNCEITVEQGIYPFKLSVTSTYKELEETLAEVAVMKGFDQRSDFHSLTLDEHAKAVVAHLKQDPFLSDNPNKNLIFLAGYLHDIGKTSPRGMQIHPRDKEKRQYINHEKESEKMVREILLRNFDISPEEVEFVACLVGFHASALNLVSSFRHCGFEPKGRKLKPFEKFIGQIGGMGINISLEEKMRVIFALNRADKLSGYNYKSDKDNPKVISIIERSKIQVAILDELIKAISAILAAVSARKDGYQTSGVIKIKSGEYICRKS